MKITDRSLPKMRYMAVLLFSALFFTGVLFGCTGCFFSKGSWFEAALTASADLTECGMLKVYSSFLFGHITYLAITFMFGLTFLGVIVIPAALYLKGMTVGIELFTVFRSQGSGAYMQKWLLYWPSVFCIAALILFSVYAARASVGSCKQLFRQREFPLRLSTYVLIFFFALLIIAVSGVIYCSLYWGSEILF